MSKYSVFMNYLDTICTKIRLSPLEFYRLSLASDFLSGFACAHPDLRVVVVAVGWDERSESQRTWDRVAQKLFSRSLDLATRVLDLVLSGFA